MDAKLYALERKHPFLAYLLLGLICLPAVIIWILFWIGYFTSFGSSDDPYEFLYPVSQVSQIQLVHISEEFYLYQYSVDEIPTMLEQAETLCVTVEQADFSPFLAEFSHIPCRGWFNDPNPCIEGRTIMITYANGSRDWVCASGTFYCDVPAGDNSMTWRYFDRDTFSSFLTDWGCQKESDQ